MHQQQLADQLRQSSSDCISTARRHGLWRGRHHHPSSSEHANPVALEAPGCLVSPNQCLAWSHTDEGGIDDTAIITKSCWTDFAETTAAALGDVVEVESGEHFSTHGVQYAHQAPGDYDLDGFRVIVKR